MAHSLDSGSVDRSAWARPLSLVAAVGPIGPGGGARRVVFTEVFHRRPAHYSWMQTISPRSKQVCSITSS
jgi:hypothetical protein